MATWKEIRDEAAEMLADGKPLEDVISKLEKRKNEMAKVELIEAIDEIKKLKPMTNEEWLATLSTEEKAEVLNDLYWEFDYKARLYYNFEPTKKSFEKWLRQPHTEKE